MMRRLEYLGQTYFHQDWDAEASTPLGAIENFRIDESSEAVRGLRDDIASTLSRGPSEELLEDIWDRTGAVWDPRLAGWSSYRGWFEAMLRVLSGGSAEAVEQP